MWAAATPLLAYSLSVFFSIIALLAEQDFRPVLCLLVFLFGLFSFLHLNDISSDIGQASILGLFILIWLSHILNILLLEKYVISATSKSQRWHAAYKMLFNARWLGTSRRAPNVGTRGTAFKHCIGFSACLRPATVDTTPATKSYVASEKLLQRQVFLATRALSALTIYSINRMYEQFVIIRPYPDLYKPLHISDFSPTKQTYLRRFFSPDVDLTGRETMLRIALVCHFIWGAWATFTFLHDALAFLFVGVLRLDESTDWPPLYGKLSQAYTIQSFWSKFWHSLVYRTYKSYGIRLSQYIPRLAAQSVLGTLFVQAFVFIYSGVVHALVSHQLGLCGVWEDVQWFCFNFMALVAERIMLSAGRRLLSHNATQHAGWKFVGYFWVFAFMFWSLPKSQYPKIYCAAKEA